MLRLLLDEDALHVSFSNALRGARIDARTVADIGRRGFGDEDQLEFAASAGFAILTFNVGDFASLHKAWQAAGRTHSGIIVEAQQLIGPGELVRRIENLMSMLGPASMENRLEYLSNYH